MRRNEEDAEAQDRAYAIRNARQKKLFAIEQKVEAAGLVLDELIELIEARQNGSY